jgi:hypothetical protein
MSTRQIGNSHENTFMAEAEKLGYCAFAARGSRGIIDVLCFEKHGVPWPMFSEDQKLVPIAAQIGTTNKPIAATLAELDAAPRPIGSLCLVARRHKKRKVLKDGTKGKALGIVWSYHSRFGTFATLAEAIEARS